MDKSIRDEKNKLIGLWFHSKIEEDGSITKDHYRTYNTLFGQNKAQFGLDLHHHGFTRDDGAKAWLFSANLTEEEGEFTPSIVFEGVKEGVVTPVTPKGEEE